MKKSLLYLVLIPLLSAFQCDDDEYTPDNIVENLNLIEIEDNKSEFSVGDYIFITTSIANQQTTVDNATVRLKDFMIDESQLYYYLGLYKISSEGENISVFVESVQELDGAIEFNGENPYFNILNPYDESNDSFTSKIGIKLLESGNYLLISGTSRNNRYEVIFDLNGSASVGSLQLTTSILNSDDEGIYRFTVE